MHEQDLQIAAWRNGFAGYQLLQILFGEKNVQKLNAADQL